jgi:hypothetical protein
VTLMALVTIEMCGRTIAHDGVVDQIGIDFSLISPTLALSVLKD